MEWHLIGRMFLLDKVRKQIWCSNNQTVVLKKKLVPITKISQLKLEKM